MHPSLYPASWLAERSSGTYSGWSWLLPPVSLQMTHKHVNGEGQLTKQARTGLWLNTWNCVYYGIYEHIMSRSSCYTGSWETFLGLHITGLHTPMSSNDQYAEGVATMCGCGSSNSHWVSHLSYLRSLPHLSTHFNSRQADVTDGVPVRCVRPSSCRPCCPSFW